MKKFKKIVVIDDDVTCNFVTEKIIKFLALTEDLEVFSNGKQALDKINHDCIINPNHCPDLILLDMEMPLMDGIQFVKAFAKLKIDKSNLHIALLTTSSPSSAKIKSIRSLGLRYFIDKPLEITKMKSLCEQIWKENPEKFIFFS